MQNFWLTGPLVAISIGMALGYVSGQNPPTAQTKEQTSNFLAARLDSDIGGASPEEGRFNASVEAKLSDERMQKELIQRIVAELQHTDSNTRSEEKRKALSEVIRAQLIEMEAHRKAQVEALEKRVNRLKQALELRSKNLETIVENRVKSLLGESSELDWDWQLPDGSPTDSDPLLKPPAADAFMYAEAAERYARSLHDAGKKSKLNARELATMNDEIQKITAEKAALIQELKRLTSSGSQLRQNNDGNPEKPDDAKTISERATLGEVEAYTRRLEDLNRELNSRSKELEKLRTKLAPLSKGLHNQHSDDLKP